MKHELRKEYRGREQLRAFGESTGRYILVEEFAHLDGARGGSVTWKTAMNGDNPTTFEF